MEPCWCRVTRVRTCYKLTPDITGSYVNGTWTQLASLESNYDPYAMAEAVLADGRVLIEGGEYNFGSFSFTNLGEVYDPVANTWTPLTPPAGWEYIGDSPCAVLPNGHFIIGRKFDMQMAELDPHTMTWTAMGSSGKSDWNAEEGWTLLPDGTLLTVDVLNNPNSERYIPSQQIWVSDGSTIANLQGPPEVGCIHYGGGQYCPPGETGNAIHASRRNGLRYGCNAHGRARRTHFGLSSGTHAATIRAPGPPAPTSRTAMTPVTTGRCCFPMPRCWWKATADRFYEWDGTNFTPTLSSFGGPLMVLPNGQVLVGGSQVYTPSTGGGQIYAPVVIFAPSSVTRGQTYHAIGRGFNGWSQAASFGDEFETATNYPLVRIVNNATGHVFYARTHDHSTMGIATKSFPTYTYFDVPANMETGASKLYVVANGFQSNAIQVTVN